MASKDPADDEHHQSSEQRDSDEFDLRKIDPLAGDHSEADDAFLVARILGEPPPPPPRFAGRYVLLERLGRGGMGEVHAAYDVTLDCKVALKFLRLQDEQDARAARERLVREAQAMAQIRKHANVVQVLNAGAEGERVYLAMEYIDGPNLGEWQENGRGVAEILDAYLQAGQGLVAIHAANLVHRDFKPTNAFVTVDEAGKTQVAVGDLGLAFATEPSAERPAGVDIESALHPAVPLTATGMRLGTIQYMAPEQLRGERAGARSDQFAFCVSLYEALCGQRPFRDAGRVPAALLEAMRKGMPAPKLANGKALPAHVERVLRRGLLMDPAARFPDMRSLLAELAPRPRRIWPWVTAGVVLAALAIVFMSREQESCEVVAAGELTGIWNAPIQERLPTRLSPVAGTPLGRALAALEQIMNDQATKWRSERADVCKGERDGIADELLAARQACLRQNRRTLARVSRTWFAGGGEITQPGSHPYDDAVALHELRACTRENAALLGAQEWLSPFEDPARYEKLTSLDDELAAIEDLERQGKYEDAEQQARATLAEAEALKNEPLLAEARFRLGHVLTYLDKHDDAMPLLESATVLAAVHDMKASALDFWLYRLKHAIVALADIDLAHRWTEVTKYFLLMTGDFGHDNIWQAEYEEALGLLASREDKPEEAARHHGEALRIRQGLFSPGGSDLHAILLSKSLNNLANVERAKRPEQAAAHYQEALQLRESALTPDHPLVGEVLFNLGLLAAQQGDHDGAMRYLDRALGIQIALPVERIGAVLNRLVAMGFLELDAHDRELAAGRRDAARAHLDRAAHRARAIADLHLRLKEGRPTAMQDPRRIFERLLLARVHELRGEWPQALDELRAVLDIHARENDAARCGDLQDAYRDTLVSTGSVLCEMGRADEARTKLAEALNPATQCADDNTVAIRERITREITRRECRP